MSGTCTVSVYFSNNKIFAALRYLLFCLTRVLVLYFRRILVNPAFKMFNNTRCAKATHIYISFCKELFCPSIILLAINLTLKKGCVRQWFWKGLVGIFLVCILRSKSCCYYFKKKETKSDKDHSAHICGNTWTSISCAIWYLEAQGFLFVGLSFHYKCLCVNVHLPQVFQNYLKGHYLREEQHFLPVSGILMQEPVSNLIFRPFVCCIVCLPVPHFFLCVVITEIPQHCQNDNRNTT